MGNRSFLDQLAQVGGTGTYNEAVASAHTEGVAQAQTSLEGDLNVLRTLLKDTLGETHWYTTPDMSLKASTNKFFLNVEHAGAFDDVASGTGTSSTAFDAAIKGITGHNDGLGADTVAGVVLNATLQHHLEIRDHATLNPIEDGSGNVVYGKLSHSSTIVEAGDGDNQLSGYASITGVTDANTGPGKMLWIEIVDDTGGYYHVDIWKNAAKDEKVAHTATYNSTGNKALVADNASGLGGTITVDAIVGADADITIRFGTYTISWYSMVDGTETAYNFTVSKNIDLAAVILSRQYKDLPWERFLDLAFHDITGVTGNVADTAVTVSGMQYLLNTLTTQHQVNLKVDKLGHTNTDAEGAHLIAVDDTATGSNGYWTGEYVQEVLNEIKTQIGGTTSTAYNFTGGTGTLLTDNAAVYASLNALDQGFVHLLATDNIAYGASMVGIHDEGEYTTETTVEGALQEIYGKIADIAPDKIVEVDVGPILANTNHDLPSGTYTPDDGKNMDVYLGGQLLVEGAGNDYEEVDGDTIKFLFAVKAHSNITYIIRK